MIKSLYKQYSRKIFAAGLVALSSISSALAQTPVSNSLDSSNPIASEGLEDVPSLINKLFNIIVFAAGAIFIVLLLIGGIQYLTAAGNEENLGKAKGLMINSIVGLIIVMASWAIGTWILGMLGFHSGNRNPWISNDGGLLGL